MIFNFFRQNRMDPAIVGLYEKIVHQARLPVFFTYFGVPDTLDGRFDLQLLHTFLIIRRLQNTNEPGKAQQLIDLFFIDMDRSLREMGVGDLSVSKKIKPMAEAFYGRSQVYTKALNEQDQKKLSKALSRNLALEKESLDGKNVTGHALASYIMMCDITLTSQPDHDVLTGIIKWAEINNETKHSGRA